MSTKDELAELIQDVGEYIPGSYADDYTSPSKAADAILAAGYRKPRVITTVEELDALPPLAVILATWLDVQAPTPMTKEYSHDWFNPADGDFYIPGELELPVTVLYEPESKS